ncbi:MAG: hypothetical protein C0603_10520 [Denitrovibrio sp.]|nr:MAG: hypothetical protein C0603_10520 [Denitrovibrio sp.]
MSKQRKETLIDELLVFMNDEIESTGHTIGTVRFDFSEQGEDTIKFAGDAGLEYDELMLILNTCKSRKYIIQKIIGAGQYGQLELSEEGQGRAISVEAAKIAPPRKESSEFHIGELNASGSIQIGNNNTQNIENFFTTIVERIDQSDATDEEKKEAKNRLKSFLEHPLTNTALGLTPSVIKGLFGVE